jgi:GTP-binding protein Era
MGEKLAIVSSKVQTTRHRIKGIRTEPEYQIIFSDTPGIIEPRYKLHERMMQAVKGSLEDADVALLLVDVRDKWEECDAIFSSLRLKVPALVVLNKTDTVPAEKSDAGNGVFKEKPYAKEVVRISALKQGAGIEDLLQAVLKYLPEGEPFFAEDELTDLSERFFVAEMIREKSTTCLKTRFRTTPPLVHEFKQKSSLLKIGANIIVQRETQKAIIIGEGGNMIKKIGSEARKDIEKFVGQKVFLELFVKVRPKWRENDLFLKNTVMGKSMAVEKVEHFSNFFKTPCWFCGACSKSRKR